MHGNGSGIIVIQIEVGTVLRASVKYLHAPWPRNNDYLGSRLAPPLRSWAKNLHPDYKEKALEAIDSLVSERLVVGDVYRDGRVNTVWSSAAGSKLPEWLAQEKGRLIELRSWLGTHDRDIDW